MTLLAGDGGDPAAPAHRLRSMFAPRSIAIVGASDRSGWSHHTVENLRRTGYPGEVHLVSRKGGQAHGAPTVKALDEVPDGVELAYVITGRDSLPSIIEQAHARGIPNLVVIAAGFGETGQEGAALERQLVEMAEERGITLLGPNNLGFVNLADNVAPWSQMMPWPVAAGGAGVLSQSGALGLFLLNYLQQRDVGLSHLVTLGNEAMVTVAEGIDYLVDQPAARVIALYLETVRHPDAFVAAVDRALLAGKPVVAYKAGRGKTGARVAAAHTGALAGDDAVFDAVFRQHGVIRAESIEDLVTTVGLLDAYGVLPGNRAGFVVGSGAMCGVISDTADLHGVAVPELAPQTADALRAGGLPEFATPQNPLDTTGYVASDPRIMPMAEEAVSRDPNIDVLVVNSAVPSSPEAAARMDSRMRHLAELSRTSPVPVIPMEFLPSDRTAFSREYRRSNGIPHVVDSFSRGVQALGKAAWWAGRHRARGTRPELAKPLSPVLGGRPSRGRWSELDAMALLRDNGVPVLPAALVTTAGEALAAAGWCGGSVSVKVVSPDLPHKSDVGGVALNVPREEAGAAFDGVLAAVRAAAPHAVIEGAVVSPMRAGGLEVLVGVVRDPVWGLMLAVGLGGMWAEAIQDVVLRRLPVSEAEVLAALSELKAYPLLAGARGGAAVDVAGLAAAAARIGGLAAALGDDLIALEVNPLLVSGDRVEALDALVTWVS